MDEHGTGEMFDYDEPPQTSGGWPVVIGVISLIYACGGLLCQVAAGSMAMLGDFLASLGGLDVEIPPVIKAIGVGLAAMTFIAGLIMLMGAIHLLRRRRAGPKLLKAWVVLRLILIAVGFSTMFITAPAQIEFQRTMLEAQNERVREAGREDLVKPIDDESIWRTHMIQGVIMTGITAIYPVFIGIWLSRRPIKDEVAKWE